MPKTPIKVLLIEDNPADALLLEESLGSDPLADFQVTVAEQLRQGLEKLKAENFDILLLDLGLPDSQGLETFETAHTQFPEMPVIVLSGRTDELFALQAVQAGAQDYLVKGEAGWNLTSRAIRYALERHQSQSAMRASEERFSTVFHSSPTSIAITRLSDNRIVEVNKAWTEITGYSSAEVVGRKIEEFNLWVYPEERGKIINLLSRDGVAHSLEFKIRRKSGQISDMLFSGEMIELDGEACMLSMALDITERKQMEEVIQEKERFIQATYDTLDEHICVLDENYIIISTNRGWRRFANQNGHPQDDFMGVNYLSICEAAGGQSDQEAARFSKGIQAVMRKEIDEFSMEYPCDSPTEKRWFMAKVIPFPGEGATRLVVAHTNISVQKQSEDALRQSEERHRLISGLISDYAYAGVGFPDGTTRTDWISGAFEQITGYTVDEIKSLPLGFASLLFAEDLDKLASQKHILLEGKSLSIEYRIRRKNGEVRWLLDHMSRQTNETADGGVGILGAVEDITERKKAELMLAENEAKLKEAEKNANLGYYDIDTASGKTIWSEETYRIFGLKPEEYDPNLSDYNQYLHQDDAQKVFDLYDECTKEGKPFDLTYRIVRPNGEIRHVHSKSTLIADEQNNPTRLFGTIQDVTERVQAAEALKEGEEKFRTFIEQSTDGLMISDEQGLVIEWNQALEQIVGMTREQALGHAVWDVQLQMMLPENRSSANMDFFRKNLQMAVQNGQSPYLSKPYEAIIQTASGEQKAILQVSFPIKTDKGHRIGAIIRDMTERKRTEQALQESEVRYRTLIENVGEGIGFVDAQEQLLFANTAGQEIFGLPPNDPTVHNLSEFTTPEQFALILEQTKQRNIGKKTTYEFEIKHLNGEKRSLLVTAVPQFDSQGQFIGTFGVFRDITGRKAAEEQLRKLSSTVEQSPLSIVITDVLGKIEYVNPQFSKITGYTLQEAMAQNPRILKSGRTTEEEYKELWDTITAGHVWRGEFLNIKKDGKTYWEFATIAPVFDDNGKITNFLALKENITARKAAEEALRKSEASLTRAQSVAQLGSWNLDLQSARLSWSAETYRIFGLPLGMPLTYEIFQSHLHPDDRDFANRAWQAALQGEPYDIEHRILVDGQVKWVRERAEMDTDAQGNFVHASGTVQDITERKEAEAKIARSEKRSQALIENTPDGVVLVGLDGKYKYASPAALKIFNYKPEDIKDANPNEQTHPDDLSMVLGVLQDLIANPSNVSTIQYRFQHQNGEWRWIESTFTNLLTEPSIEAIVINFREITERKLADEKLRESEEHLRLAYDAAELGSWREDIQTRTSHLDQRACKHYDVDETEVPSQVIFSRTHPEDLPRLREEIGMTLNKKDTDGRLTTDYRIVHRDGSIHWLSVHSRLHFEEQDGKRIPIFGTGTTQDITARKDSEQKLIQRTHQLRLINEATRMLNTSLKAQAVYDVIHASISQLLPCDTLFVSSFDPASKMISMSGGWHDGQPLDISKYEPIPLEPEGSGTQSLVIRSKEALLVPDFQARLKNTQVVQHFGNNGNPKEEAPEDRDIPRSALVAPLLVEGEVFGVIQVFSYRLNAYTEDDLQILNGFSAQAAIALSNAHLYEHIQQENLERKRAEKSLQESESKYRSLVESIQVGVVVHGSDSSILFSNPQASQLLGLTQDQLLGKTAIDPDWYFIRENGTRMPLDEYPVSHALATDAPLSNLTIGIVRPDQKEVIWVQCNTHSIRSLDRQLQQVVVKFNDITERKKAEEALAESEKRFRSIFETSGMGIFEVTVDGKIININSAYARMFGFSSVEDARRNITTIAESTYVHPQKRAQFINYVLEHPGMASFENEYRRRDGSTFIGELKLQAMQSAEKQNTYIFGYVEDITHRKQAETEVRERTEDLELVNKLNEAINRGDNLDSVIELFARELGRISQCKDATIYLLSPDGKHLVMQHLSMPPVLLKKIEQMIGRPLPQVEISIKEGGYFQNALLSEQGIITTDPKVIQKWMEEFTETNYLPTAIRGTVRKLIPQIYKLLNIGSTLTLPLVSDKKIIGLLNVSSAGILTEKDSSRIRKISGQVTAVILREQANEALFESEERYRSIFDGVQDAIFVETKEGVILGVNSRACEMYGYTREEFLGKTVKDLVPAGSSIFPAPGMQVNNSRIPLETVNRRANGALFPAEINGGLQTLNGKEVLLVMVRDITERKQAEEALNESKLLFHLLIESLPQNIYAKDTDGHFIFANQNYCVTQGSTLEEILGKTDFELHPFELAAKYLLDDQQVIQTGKTLEIEEEHQPLGGKKTYVQVIKTPFSYSKGQPAGILGIFWDITERKQIEENTRQRIKALELLYENSMAVNQSLNPKEISQKVIELLGEKLDWHHTAIRLFNEQDNSLELAAFDLQGIQEEEEKESLEHLSKLITHIGKGLSGWALQQSQTLRIGDVSSDPHYVESYPGIHSGLYAPLKSGERLLGVISVESEKPNAFSEADEQLIITLANQAAVALENARLYEEINRYAEELELRVQERTAEIETTRQRLELAVKTAGIGIWELDIKKNEDYWDDRLFTLYGLSKENAMPNPETWHNVIHPDDLAQQLKLLDTALHNEQPYDTEFRVIWPDESIHHIKSTGIVIYNADDEAERMIGANQDITLHKQAEETLRLANVEMERGLRMKNEFLANMSHELRTPLNAILGISESLEEQISGYLNEKQLGYIRTIIESGRHLLDLINDILDLSKIEAGKLELNIQIVSVEKLCTTSLRMVKELAQKKSLNVSLHIDESVKFISGDERRLKQSLVNLLGNAVKFTPQGKKIGLEVRGNAQANEVAFIVWDEGIGINQADMQRLFKPFVQLNAGLAREYAGTGLGLALVAQMTRLHGGHIGLTSELNAGSRFIITLPWMPQEQGIQPQAQFQTLEKKPMSKIKHTGKILIVDDTEVVTQLMSEYLRHKGYQTFTAYNGKEGVMLARQEKPQIILMDIMMPVMNGLEATKQIRADADLHNIPIIGLTALAMSTDRDECLAAGMNDHLSKPIEMQDLIKIIERYLFPNP